MIGVTGAAIELVNDLAVLHRLQHLAREFHHDLFGHSDLRPDGRNRQACRLTFCNYIR
jgi:hypothetical protein